MKKFRRYCEFCGRGMNEGYLVDNSLTYCSERCARMDLSDAKFEELMARLEADEDFDGIYWTEWEEDDE